MTIKALLEVQGGVQIAWKFETTEVPRVGSIFVRSEELRYRGVFCVVRILQQDDVFELYVKRLDDNLVILKPEFITVQPTARIDSWVKIEGGQGVTIGDYVHVASFCHLNIGGGELVMQKGSAISSGGKIVTGSNKLDGYSMSAAAPKDWQRIERGKVVIEENAIIFTNAVILPDVTVGRGAVIASGAVVTKNVPPYEIWGGVPAKKIGIRELVDKPATRNGDAYFEDL